MLDLVWEVDGFGIGWRSGFPLWGAPKEVMIDRERKM
jgi:hypothetical protein